MLMIVLSECETRIGHREESIGIYLFEEKKTQQAASALSNHEDIEGINQNYRDTIPLPSRMRDTAYSVVKKNVHGRRKIAGPWRPNSMSVRRQNAINAVGERCLIQGHAIHERHRNTEVLCHEAKRPLLMLRLVSRIRIPKLDSLLPPALIRKRPYCYSTIS